MTQRVLTHSGYVHLKTVGHRNYAVTDKINPASRILLRKSSSSHGNINLFSTAKAPLRQQRHLGPHIYAAIKKVSSKNVACSKTLVALPGKETDIEALCQQVVTFSKQRMGDRSAGIIQFDCSKVITNFHLQCVLNQWNFLYFPVQNVILTSASTSYFLLLFIYRTWMKTLERVCFISGNFTKATLL